MPECVCIVNSADALGNVLHSINQKVVSIEGQYINLDIKITNISESSIPTKILSSKNICIFLINLQFEKLASQWKAIKVI